MLCFVLAPQMLDLGTGFIFWPSKKSIGIMRQLIWTSSQITDSKMKREFVCEFVCFE